MMQLSTALAPIFFFPICSQNALFLFLQKEEDLNMAVKTRSERNFRILMSTNEF